MVLSKCRVCRDTNRALTYARDSGEWWCPRRLDVLRTRHAVRKRTRREPNVQRDPLGTTGSGYTSVVRL